MCMMSAVSSPSILTRNEKVESSILSLGSTSGQVMRPAHLTSSTMAGRAGTARAGGIRHPGKRPLLVTAVVAGEVPDYEGESSSRCCGIRALHQEPHDVDGDQC